jgi:hypothetical protein
VHGGKVVALSAIELHYAQGKSHFLVLVCTPTYVNEDENRVNGWKVIAPVFTLRELGGIVNPGQPLAE